MKAAAFETLKKNYQFRTVYNKGKSIANKHFVMFVLKNRDDEMMNIKQINRLGISVSKKIGNAVVRNKVRRRIRESFREVAQKVSLGSEIIVIARIPTQSATYKEISQSLKHLLYKHNLL